MRYLLSIFSSSLLLLSLISSIALADQAPAASQSSSVTPFSAANLQWVPSEAPFPPGAFGAMLEGDMSKPGPFTVRFKMPPGYTIAPHWHSTTERVTVLEGTLSVTPGTEVDMDMQTYLGPGSFFLIKDHDPHYAVAGDAWTIIQVSAEGPFDIHFVNPDGSEIQLP